MSSSPQRLPALTYVLAAGVFLMGTTEFMVAGILPEIAADLDVSVSNAGLMITIFALGMIVGTPTMAILTLKIPRRVTLALALVIFAVGHVVVALSDDLTFILLIRGVTALATGAFWAVAAVVAAKAAGPLLASKALGVVVGGGMLANVIGVPLGSFAGQTIGWRGPFWGLAVIALIATVIVYVQVPKEDPSGTPPSVKAELKSLKDARVWLVLGAAAIASGSTLAAYSFIAPLLTQNAGLAPSSVPLVLVGYGIGAFFGSNLGGALAARGPYRVLWFSSAATFLVLVSLFVFSHNGVLTVGLMVLLGLFGMSTNPILIGMAVRFADQAPTLASALTTASFNVGNAIGTWVAGLSLKTQLGANGPVLVAAAIAGLYFLPLALLVAVQRRRNSAV